MNMIIKFSGHMRAINVIIKDEVPAETYNLALESTQNQEPDLVLNEDGSVPVISTDND
jgi:hypothetical protein